MFSLIIATTNPNKVSEIGLQLDTRSIILKSLADFQNFPQVEEDGATFKDNALKKAREYFRFFNLPVVADDSGLVVPALNDEPGVFSARYAGPGATYEDNNRLLIKKIKQISEKERLGKFICQICYKDGYEERIFSGITKGIILTHLTGEKGFGYDPLFYIAELNKTYAQLTTEEKNRISHRGKAIYGLNEFLKNKIKGLPFS